MKDVIIFDTNGIRNTGFNEFLGNREILRQLLPDADFLIPELALDEVKRQKKIEFEKVKRELLSNQLVKVFSPDLSSIKSTDIDTYIAQMQDKEQYSFEVIPCVHGELVDQFRLMAILNEAPFNKGSDKGFKDACIYISILNFLPTLKDRSVYMWSNDDLLKEAFEKHENVTVINSIETYHQKSVRFMMDEYFYGILTTEIGEPVTDDNIVNSWKNFDDNWVIDILVNEKTYLVEIDSREIVAVTEEDSMEATVNELINTANFATTHVKVTKLLPLTNFLSKNNISKLKKASKNNYQFKGAIGYGDVEEFLQELSK